MLSYNRFALTKYLQNLPHFGMSPNMAKRTEHLYLLYSNRII